MRLPGAVRNRVQPRHQPQGGQGDSSGSRSWALQLRSDKALDDLARLFNAQIRGWLNYYGAFYKSALYPVLRYIDCRLATWAARKFKRLKSIPIPRAGPVSSKKQAMSTAVGPYGPTYWLPYREISFCVTSTA